ncbi:GIY-YIG nuclease family protein [Candidatus Gracilibacteria bacterium]|nr:GIY-YIG nuclease family protein [Candidatus Gracilibacteria bacterium]MCF7819004.1 GIY-YIG nuclease family protein [Candidatus Gracilibacteria bacterium]
MRKLYYVYLLTNPTRTVFYVGVTNNLIRRCYEHKNKLIDGFTKKYNCSQLMYFEETNDISIAITREKQLKHYSQKWKSNLIREINPEWRDLSSDFL